MILSALNDYYEKLANSPGIEIAKPGFSSERLDFALVINREGVLLDIEDLRDLSGKSPKSKYYMVPASFGRSGRVLKPFNFWDKTSYSLGISKDFDEAYVNSEFSINFSNDEHLALTVKTKLERLQEQHSAFIKHHMSLLDTSKDIGAVALKLFLQKWKPLDLYENTTFNRIKDVFIDSNITFRLDGTLEYIFERTELKSIYLNSLKIEENDNVLQSPCLVTGELSSTARLHDSIRGVNGAQSAGAAIVSFNKNSFESYGKVQGDNSPVSESVVFAYTTALNYLLRREASNRQRLQLGDATVVFWAEASTQMSTASAEDLFTAFINPDAEDAQETEKLKRVLETMREGRPLSDVDKELTEDIKIFVLGLSPNAARLSVRFWLTDKLEDFARRIAQHYEDLHIEPIPWRVPPAIWRLLLTTAPMRQGKSEAKDVSPHLAGEITRAILTGSAYPYSLLSNLLMRFRADGEITGLRVALIKAVITRFNRLSRGTTYKGELPVSLDILNTQSGYLLGRLFAVLERVQQDALGRDINATIRDRYYGAASATPAQIFPVLLRNTQNHLSKIRKSKPGLAVAREKIISEVMNGLDATFPRSLRMEEQGEFALGYYHQQQAFFTKKETTDAENLTEGSE